MIPIYFDELAEVLKCCIQLRPNECTPADLRKLMAEHLTHNNPELAQRVMAFDGPQLLALSAFVFQAQALVGMGGGHAALHNSRMERLRHAEQENDLGGGR